MKEIYCITDYKDIFGSRFDAEPYRSGLDKNLLVELFKKNGVSPIFLNPCDISFTNQFWKGKVVLYTSSEEYNLYYKTFIEDIVFGLKEAGAILLPDALFLRANNNKVFMEIIEQVKLPKELHNLPAKYFGTFDEIKKAIKANEISYPCVIKSAAGAKSRGVALANNDKELLVKAKKIAKTFRLKVFVKELIRMRLHRGYLPESAFQGKLIIQPFVKGLQNDWKVLIYENKYFILKRSVRVNDFRASGSGLNYKSGGESEFPIQMLSYLREFYLNLDLPNLSIDFGYDGTKGYVFEYQAVHYGTYTQQKSNDYYEYENGDWRLKQNDLKLEEVYVYSIVEYLKRKNLPFEK